MIVVAGMVNRYCSGRLIDIQLPVADEIGIVGNRHVRLGREAPDRPCDRAGARDRIDPPIVRCVDGQSGRSIFHSRLLALKRIACAGVYVLETISEIHFLENCTESRFPVEGDNRVDKSGGIDGTGVPGVRIGDRKAADLALPRGIRVQIIDGIDSPVIDRARIQRRFEVEIVARQTL